MQCKSVLRSANVPSQGFVILKTAVENTAENAENAEDAEEEGFLAGAGNFFATPIG